jgi:hypothetical protein
MCVSVFTKIILASLLIRCVIELLRLKIFVILLLVVLEALKNVSNVAKESVITPLHLVNDFSCGRKNVCHLLYHNLLVSEALTRLRS